MNHQDTFVLEISGEGAGERTLTKLDTPQPCGIEYLADGELHQCRIQAHWSVDNTPVCDLDIQRMAGMNSDNEQFFAPALQTSSREEHI